MILIVDDMPEIVTWLVETVKDAGYYADWAVDGEAALFKMKYIRYSMAIIDIRLHDGANGNEIARRVKNMPFPFCDVPLVAMTGSRLTVEDDLFVDVLNKPFLPRDLRAIIDKYANPPIADLHTKPENAQENISMTDVNYNLLPNAPDPAYVQIVMAVIRGLLQIASGLGFAWGYAVTGDGITMAATAIVMLGTLLWSAWQKIQAVRKLNQAAITSAVKSAQATAATGVPAPIAFVGSRPIAEPASPGLIPPGGA